MPSPHCNFPIVQWMQLMQQSLSKDEAYTRPQNDMFFSCWVMCPLSPTFIYNFLNVIIYLMLTWLNQTTSCHMFYQHHPLYADLAHPYIYCFLNVFCIYADLYHPDPSYVQIFYLHHPLYVYRLCSLIHLLLSKCVMHLCWLISPRPFICSDF